MEGPFTKAFTNEAIGIKWDNMKDIVSICQICYYNTRR